MSQQDIQEQIAAIDERIVQMKGMRDILTDEKVDAALAELRQKRRALEAQLQDAGGTAYKATISGGGAIAQGSGATAVGKRGINVGGNVSGNIVTGDRNTVTDVGGDLVHGDKIDVGDISDSSNIAIGRKAQAQEGLSGAELAAIFQKVYEQIEARPPDPDVDIEEIKATVEQIEEETAGPEAANEKRLERWLGNLARMAPDIIEVMAASLAGPVAGGAMVLKKIINRVQQKESEAGNE